MITFANRAEAPISFGDEPLVSIPPVIVSPFTISEITAAPEQIALRNLEAIWPISGAGEGVKIAYIDTGVDPDHPEFANCLLDAKDFTKSRSGIMDKSGHGGHVGSLLAGVQCGGSPKAKLISLKALNDEGWGQSNWIADAIYAAIDYGVHLINMSLGSSQPSAAIYKALLEAIKHNIIIFAATGNDGASRNSYPADFNDVAVGVAAIDFTGNIAQFSNRGQGTDICDYGYQVPGAKSGTKGFVRQSGTSMATPVATSMAANRLSYEARYNLPVPTTLTQRYELFQSVCKDLGRQGRDPEYGWGQIDEVKAFGKPPAQVDPKPEDPKPQPNPPTAPGKDEKLGEIWRGADGTIMIRNKSDAIITL